MKYFALYSTTSQSEAGLCLITGKLQAALVASVALMGVILTGSGANAQIATAGRLLVDLRSADLDVASITWANQSTDENTVGDFMTKDGLNLNVAMDISDGGTTVPLSLHVPTDVNKSVISTLGTPASLEGNNTRSVEAWVLAESFPSGSTVVGWGAAGNDMMSSFRYAQGASNGMFSGWFNDTGWGAATLPTNAWTHVAWTYDGDDVRGYVDGALISTGSINDLSTIDALISVGAGRNGGTDAFNGYIADIRVHTGVLAASQVLNNFNAGIGAEPGLLCDFDGDADCDSADFATLRDNMFTEGDASMGDVDRDGFITLADYRAFKDDPNTVVGSIPAAFFSPSQVPEPSSMCFLSISLIFLGRAVARRQR